MDVTTYVAVATNNSNVLGLAASDITAGKTNNDTISTINLVVSQIAPAVRTDRGMPIRRMAKAVAMRRASTNTLRGLGSVVNLSPDLLICASEEKSR